MIKLFVHTLHYKHNFCVCIQNTMMRPTVLRNVICFQHIIYIISVDG